MVIDNDDAGDGWPLRVDRTHPILFDHQLDHVPGMLLLEAARQAGFSAISTAIVGYRATSLLACRLEFLAFCELNHEVRVHTALSGVHWRDNLAQVRVRIEQHGTDVATGTVEYDLRLIDDPDAET